MARVTVDRLEKYADMIRAGRCRVCFGSGTAGHMASGHYQCRNCGGRGVNPSSDVRWAQLATDLLVALRHEREARDG